MGTRLRDDPGGFRDKGDGYQDVFSLIFQSYIVVCDFTGKNPKVFYGRPGLLTRLGSMSSPSRKIPSTYHFDVRQYTPIRTIPEQCGRAERLYSKNLKIA